MKKIVSMFLISIVGLLSYISSLSAHTCYFTVKGLPSGYTATVSKCPDGTYSGCTNYTSEQHSSWWSDNYINLYPFTDGGYEGKVHSSNTEVTQKSLDKDIYQRIGIYDTNGVKYEYIHVRYSDHADDGKNYCTINYNVHDSSGKKIHSNAGNQNKNYTWTIIQP